MPQYRITIGSKAGPEHARRPPGKLEAIKAVLLGVLALAILIGIVIRVWR